MKIKARLRLNSFISLGVLILILLSLAWSFREMSIATRNLDQIAEMRKVAFERIILRDDYLLNQEERARTQWLAKSDALRRLLESASEIFTSSYDLALLKEARGNFDITLASFSKFMEDHEREGRAAKGGFVFNDAESRLIGQVFINAYALNDNLNRLYESASKTRTTARDRGLLAVIVAVIVGMLASVINTALTNRTFSKRIVELGNGIEIIGAGDLDYRIGVEGDDELTALARQSNEMAAKLKQSHTSVENLQKEIEENKRVEDALRESEGKYRTLVENIPQKIFTKDRRSVYVSCNDNFARDLGITPEEIAGKSDYDFFPKELVDKYRSDDERILESGESEGIEEQYMLGSEKLWIYTVKTPLRDKEGHTAGILGVFSDITERKKAEDALQESERRLREAQKMAQLGYWSWDVRSGIVEWSEEVYNIFHLDPNKFIPHIDSILAMSPWPEDHERDKELIRKAMESHEKGDYEQRFIRPDGSTGYYYSTFQGKYDEEGNLISIIGTVLDITERKSAEEKLRLAHQRLRRFVDSNIVGIIIADFAGRVVEANDYYLHLIGYTREELESGKVDWRAITPSEWLPADEQAIRELHERGTCTPYEKEYVRRDGSRVPVFLADALLPGPEEQIAAFVLDLTERKVAAEQLQRTLADLERSNKELEQFAYIASHDLQEPLRMVASYTQLLAQRYEGQLDDKARMFIDYAVDGAVRMQRLINDLLAYSRVNTQGKTPEMIDSHAVLGEALRNLSAAIEENRAIVSNDDLPMVRADAIQLSQLFQNLIGNAIKFHSAELPRIQVSACDLGREWQFSVKDNGIGIDAQYADKVFIIFQRLHTRQEYSGTGIGLAICKRILERHGGRIWFESEPGKGSTFYFTLPK